MLKRWSNCLSAKQTWKCLATHLSRCCWYASILAFWFLTWNRGSWTSHFSCWLQSIPASPSLAVGDPHWNSLKTGSSMKFTISCRNLFKYPSKLVKYWRYGSKSTKEVTLYVNLLISMFCRGLNMTGYFPFPSRLGSRPRYGFSFCMVCTRGPHHFPVSRSVRLSRRAHSPNIEATLRTINPIILLAHHCPCN